LGARRGTWEDQRGADTQPEDRCEEHARAARGGL
jgi:hypothetical protein